MSQQIKTFLIAIGPNSTPDGTVTPAEFDSLVYQKYLSVGYKILQSQYLGEALGEDRTNVGARFLFILERDYEDKPTKVAPEKKEEKAPTKTEEVVIPA